MGRSVLHWVCVCTLGVVALVGCQDVSQFRTYRFEITESLPDLTAASSEGVEICEADTDNCVVTDPNGGAALDVPSNQEITFTLVKEGFGSYIQGDVSDETFGVKTVFRRLYPNDQLAAIAEQLGTPYPWEAGMVALAVLEIPPGVTFTPVGSTSDEVGEPFYYDADSEPKQYRLGTLPFSDRRGGAILVNLLPLAQGGFTEVTPGEQQFEFGGTAGDCSPPRMGLASRRRTEQNQGPRPRGVHHLRQRGLCGTLAARSL